MLRRTGKSFTCGTAEEEPLLLLQQGMDRLSGRFLALEKLAVQLRGLLL